MAELRRTGLVTRDLVKLKIGHALLGLQWRGGGERKVERVYSHEQVSEEMRRGGSGRGS